MLKSKDFLNHRELAKFVSDEGIVKADVQQIVFDSGSGHYTLFWWD